MKFTYAVHLFKGCSPMSFSLLRVPAINTFIQENYTKPCTCKYEEIIVERFGSFSKEVIYKAYYYE